MTFLHLVRHGPPRQEPTSPAWEWSLAPEGAAAVADLETAGVLPRGAMWVTSSEPKARETAALLTKGPVAVDDSLREAGRTAEYLDAAAFRGRVLAAFDDAERPASPGWEPLIETQMRVLHAAQRAVAAVADADVVLVGHGTSLTMLVAALTGDPPDVAAWQRMRMPDHCCIEWPSRLVVPWGSWAA